jgi:hypothetical protein
MQGITVRLEDTIRPQQENRLRLRLTVLLCGNINLKDRPWVKFTKPLTIIHKAGVHKVQQANLKCCDHYWNKPPSYQSNELCVGKIQTIMSMIILKAGMH